MYFWLLLFIAYLPFQVALNPGFGLDLASSRVFILLLFGAWLAKSWKLGFQWKPSFQDFIFQDACLLGFLLISGFSILAAENYWWGLRKFLFFLSVFPLYFLVRALADSWLKIKRIILVLALGAGLMALIGLSQFFSQFVFGLEKIYGFWAVNITSVFSGFNLGSLILAYPSWLVNVSGQTMMRAFSLFSDPHLLGFYLGLILPLAIILANGKKYKNLLFAICCLLFAAIALTFSRSAYLAIVVSFIILAWLLFKYLSFKKIPLLLCLSLSIFIIPATPISTRFYSAFNFGEGSNIGRLEMWEQAGRLGRENFLWGVGLGNYSLSIDPAFGFRNPITAHNLYLDIFSEMGIFALMAWLILVLGTIGGLFKIARNTVGADTEHRLIAIGLIGSLVYFSVQSFFETAIYSPVILALLMIILGLAVVLIKEYA